MTVTLQFKSWEKRIEHILLSFFLRIGAREAPENWRGEFHMQKAATATQATAPSLSRR